MSNVLNKLVENVGYLNNGFGYIDDYFFKISMGKNVGKFVASERPINDNPIRNDKA